jgi:putative transposase
MNKVFRYRLYPTRAQETALNHTLDLCRWVYNETLATRRNAYEATKIFPYSKHTLYSRYDTQRLLLLWKEQQPTLTSVYSQVLQEIQYRVDLAFKAFFRRVKAGEKAGYPRFKGKGWYDSFTYPQSGFALDGSTLQLSKIGSVKIKLHRPIAGEIKRLNIKRSSTGKWFACFTVECEPNILEHTNDAAVGIDVGLTSFATLSNGEHINNPRFFRAEEKQLAKAQRKKSKKVVAKVHERIANKRSNFAHQLSRKLVNTYGVIAFEDLNIKGMMQNRYLAKSIGDVAWSQFIAFTQNKAENAGSVVVMVDPKNTTQECSRCGAIVKKELKDRTHSCDCGLVLDRDENAAKNILTRGLSCFRQQTAIEAACVS